MNKLNGKQKKILKKICSNPISRNISWKDGVSLLEAFGTRIEEGKGSAVDFKLNNVDLTLHRNHGKKENNLMPYQIKKIRKFLINAGAIDED